MPKLNQIIAIQAGKKTQAKETLTQAYHQVKKPELLSGLVRTYQPRDEDGEPQPDERNHVKYEATKEHPAQVEMYMEDVWVGTWTTTKLSGAIPAATRNAMLERVRKLLDAVKEAREEANLLQVQTQKLGDALLAYVFD